MSDRIAILRGGKFEQVGPAHEIYSEPSSRFVAEFMGDVNLFEIERDDKCEVTHIDGIDRMNVLPTAPVTMPTGEELLMVRPEEVEFLESGESADFELDGFIIGEYMLGSRTQYEVSTASGKIVSIEHSTHKCTSMKNGSVRLGFGLDNCHLIHEPTQ